MLRPFVIAAIVLAAPSLAVGQAVKVEFQMGKVTLSATNAPLRTILTEWSRVGGTRIVNPERLVGGPVTLELTAVPERQALDVLLRDVGGYMLGPRTALVPGVSAYDRLIIVSSTAGRPAPAPAPAQVQQPARRPPPPFEPPTPDLPDDANEIDPDAPSTSAVPRPPRPGSAPPPPTQGAGSQPATPPRGNPFGALPGTGRPGVAAPAPPPQERAPNDQ